jgi:hypothetical protein
MTKDQSSPPMRRYLLPAHTVMSRRCDYIYISNFKSGCSTIRRSLWRAEYQLGFITTPPGDPHDVSLVPFDHDAHARWEESAGKFVFTFVRNPYPRVLSAYLDKIANLHEPNVWPAFAAAHGLGDRRPSFSEFLELLTAEVPAVMNPHWRPQSFLIGYGLVPFDFVGTLENLGADMQTIMRRIFGENVTVEDFAPHRTGAADQLSSYVTAKERKLIERIYEADFANFGYSTSPEIAGAGKFVLQRGLPEAMRLWGRSERLFAAEDYEGASLALEELTTLGEWPYLARQRAICLREAGRLKRKRGLKELRRAGRRGWGNRGDAGPLPLVADLFLPVRGSGGEPVDLGIAELRLAASLQPRDMAIQKHLGLALLAGGELEDGLEALIRAASLGDPKDDAVQRSLRHYRRRLAILRARRGGRAAGVAVLTAARPRAASRGTGSRSVPVLDRILVAAAALLGRVFGDRGGDTVGNRVALPSD